MNIEQMKLDQVVEDPINARKALTGIDELAASIKEIGQLVPILVRPLENNTFLLVAGHRRLAAIKQLGGISVSAVVLDRADRAREIIQGLSENTSRVDLSAGELTDAIGLLDGLEVSDEEIARALSVPENEIAAAKALAGAPKEIRTKARQLAEQHPLTILQQAALVTYADDKKALKEIESTLRYQPGQLEHAVARIEARRERDLAVKAIKEAHKGVPLVKSPGYMGYPEGCEPITNLLNEKGKKFTLATHKECPGHALEITWPYGARKPIITYWCRDWQANAHTMSPSAKFTQHVRADAPAKAAKEDPEQKRLKEERELAWAAASTVRSEWAKLHATRQLDAEAKLWVLTEILNHGYDEWGNHEHKPASIDRAFCELLGGLVDQYESSLHHQYINDEDRAYLRFLESQGYTLSDVEKGALEPATAPKRRRR